MNDRFYNCPALWGPKNGAGGDYGGKSDEQLVEDSGEIHTIKNYLEPDVYADLMRQHCGAGTTSRGELSVTKARIEEAAKDSLTAHASSGELSRTESQIEEAVKDVIESQTENKKDVTESRIAEPVNDVTESQMEEAVKDVTEFQKEEVLKESATGNSSETADFGSSSNDSKTTETTTSAGIAGNESTHFDPTCKDCLQPTRDPSAKELVMFLHALRYSGPDFDFSTPMPDWASETWDEEEKWKVY